MAIQRRQPVIAGVGVTLAPVLKFRPKSIQHPCGVASGGLVITVRRRVPEARGHAAGEAITPGGGPRGAPNRCWDRMKDGRGCGSGRPDGDHEFR